MGDTAGRAPDEDLVAAVRSDDDPVHDALRDAVRPTRLTPRTSARDEAEPERHRGDDPLLEVDPLLEDDPLLDTAVRRVAAGATQTRPFGLPGAPLSRRSPFVVGFSAALGVGLALGLLVAVARASTVLLLLALAVFLAVGLDRPVRALERRGTPRGRAVALVAAGAVTATAAFVAVVLPALVQQGTALASSLPGYVADLREQESVQALEERYGVVTAAEQALTDVDVGGRLLEGVVDAGRTVLTALGSILLVVVLTVYLLAALPALKTFAYRLAPRSRRARVGLLTDGILLRIGGFVTGAVSIAAVAGLSSLAWLAAVGVPYALALALVVAALDLVPLVGATIAAVGVTAVSFTEGTAVGLATAVFFLVYQQVENYVVYPRVMGRAVSLSPVATVVAVLLGGALGGVLGALLAIPTSAALQLVLAEVVLPRQERH